MQIIWFFVVAYVVYIKLRDYESFYKKVERMDNDPNCTIKSDKWRKAHPEYDSRIIK